MTRKTKKENAGTAAPAARDSADKLDKARGLLEGPSLAANSIDSLKMTGGVTDIDALIRALTENASRVIDGDLSRAESLLICQVQTLDALFNYMMMRSMRQEYLTQFETFMKVALRAQFQCRATLDTLATIKNPPVLIAKQANIAQTQQVNNAAIPAGEPSREREAQNAPNRLLEQQNGERLDAITTSATSGADPAMAALGQVHGAKICRR